MEMNPVKWGVIGVAKIAVDKVIPAMQASPWSTVTAIASRSLDKAEEAARRLNIARVYGSYEDLLADPDIEAIYNPLPNHLHVPYTIQAAQAGKHVLCEKPLGMNAEEARDLLRVCRQTGVKIGEAFMVRTHPQWLRTRELVQSGAIGTLRAVQGTFSFFNVESDNIRNIAEYGGGGLLDIGCYPITTSRFVCGREPERVFGRLDFDDRFKTDRLGSISATFSALSCFRLRWFTTSECTSSERRLGWRSRFPSMRRRIAPAASSSGGEIAMALTSKPSSFRS